jgi:hypothetical protein
VAQLHNLLPATFERLAGDPNRWILEFPAVPEPFERGTRFTRDAIGRRARRAAKRSAAVAAAAAAVVVAEWSAEEEGEEEEERRRDQARRARQLRAPATGGVLGAASASETTVDGEVRGAGDRRAEEDSPSFFELTPNTRAALGLVAAGLLPVATHWGARSTLLLAAWLLAAVLLPIGVARLHARLPGLFGLVAGDPQRWILESSAKSMERTLVETREAIGR